ncbi:uncharacterized protein LOC122842816 [Gambusia affinis]|uniref:uncharacterized protein LOC122842816 n=1 Tax=Gambusia affinis TaxID=33528 RepID=UPI001CDBF874|nr:uncharacterized protein LOC122842816 [Gambusia affinis]
MAVTAGLSLLTLLALQAAAQDTTYFEIGKALTFDPKPSEAINAITWKHNENIVAEYVKDKYPLEYLGDLKDRSKLDITTGILTVSNTRKSDDGVFTVEINQRVLPVKFKVVGIRKLSAIEVILRTLTCGSDKNCSLDCGDEYKDAEPIQYFWKKGENGEWQKGDRKLVISKETEEVETFTCRAENRYSDVTSEPFKNPLYKESGSYTLVAVLVPLLILVVVGGVALIAWLVISKPPCVQNLLNRNPEQPTENGKELEGLNTNSSPESAVNLGPE